LRDIRGEWRALGRELDGWLVSIRTRTAEIAGEVDDLARLVEAWQLTAGRTGEERLNESVVAAVTRTLSDLEETEGALYSHRNDLLMLEQEVSGLMARCQAGITATSTEVDRLRTKLLETDAAPLWSQAAISETDANLGPKIRNAVSDYYRSIRAYVSSEPERVVTHITLYLVALICIYLLGRRAGKLAGENEDMTRAVSVLGRPAAAAVVVAMLADWYIHPQRPGAFMALLNLMLLVPLLAIVPRLLPRRLRPAVYATALIYIADFALIFTPPHSYTGRILKVGVGLAVIATALWLMWKLYGPSSEAGDRRSRKLAGAGLSIVIITVALSVVAGLVGNVGLADLLLEGTIESAYLGLLTWLAVMVLRAVTTVILDTGARPMIRLARKHREGLRRRIFRALTVAGFIIWVVVTLDGFKILEPAYSGIRAALASTLRLGSFEIATGGIVLFLFTIWLSFLISRIVGAVLKESVYPRVRLPRGAPMAISKLTHFAILVIGFSVALAAAGLDLNRFTLLAGALGVGLGFGLQNIVSNLVSGIMVLLERPVQIGDMVRIGTNEGEIRNIGLRASVIRTWEGAEVIIPNSRLVLDEVTNWTMSDQQRRIEIQVGIAYGSDTDKASDLLLALARDHEDVLEQPEPYVIFSSFEDSSLKFSLRAWIGRFGDYLRVRSELTAAVNKALAEAGITIPFPQQDVHLRSGDAGSAEGSTERSDKGLKPDSPGKEDHSSKPDLPGKEG
jgi:small-conductance mechanosensitive channel